jgi:RiboL-PSP-HEPN
MRRLAVVTAVAALDTYMHRLVVDRAYEHDQLPGKLADLEMPFWQLLDQVEETKTAARRDPYNPRPTVKLKRYLRDRLLRITFQNFDDVSQALAMAGLAGNWPAIGGQFAPVMTRAQLEARLNAIVRRRNQIVHEGDYERQERPRGPRMTGISAGAANGDINFVSAFIDAIHAVIPAA